MTGKLLRISALLTVVLGMVLPTGLAAANGPVDPPSVDDVLYPGESLEVDKDVTTPSVPAIVDICLLEDETGSFRDDIGNLQTAAPAIYDTIVATSPAAQFAVAGFRDYPVFPYGQAHDWVYRLLSSMSPARANWLAGIAALTAGGGNDWPEAQFDAIVAAAGPDTDDCGWRDVLGVQRVLVVATDAAFHTPDMTHVNDLTSTVAALNAEDIIVIGLKAPGARGELDALAAATGGSVQPLSSDGSNIAQAILDALAELTTDVWWTIEDGACDPGLSVSLTPTVHTGVPGGTTVSFLETIAVPNATPPGDYYCTVTFWANEYPEDGSIVGEQDIHIEVISIAMPVPLDIKPRSCPNPLNIGAKGVLPVAILGTNDLDVTTIDPSTLRLEGVAPLRWEWSDVATPFEPWLGKADCWADCTEAGPDGYMDLTLKFKAQEVVAALGSVADEECRVLTLTGNFFDLRAIEGEDVVRFLAKWPVSDLRPRERDR